MRKNGWEEPTTGPDWIDCLGLMTAIGALHSGQVAVIVSQSGPGIGTGLSVAASILFDKLPGSSLPASVVVEEQFPCNEHKTLAAHSYSLLHKLDYEISKTYKNEKVWE